MGQHNTSCNQESEKERWIHTTYGNNILRGYPKTGGNGKPLLCYVNDKENQRKQNFVSLLFGAWLRMIGVFWLRDRTALAVPQGFVEPYPGVGVISPKQWSGQFPLTYQHFVPVLVGEVLRWCFTCFYLWVIFIVFCKFRAEWLAEGIREGVVSGLCIDCQSAEAWGERINRAPPALPFTWDCVILDVEGRHS